MMALPFLSITDLQWSALLPYLLPRAPQGRRLEEHRERMEAIFFIATSTLPWCALPARYGKADTVSRYFRRLTHAGLWQKLLHALAEAAPNHPLRQLEERILRACRRAHRILGLPFLVLIRRLNLRRALPGPPWLLPDPLLSETLAGVKIAPPPSGEYGHRTRHARLLAALRHLHRDAAGRRRIPRSVRLAWA